MELPDLKMFSYKPASEKHLSLHKSRKKVRALLGGNRGGKTYWGRQEVIWHLFGVHPFHEPFPPPVQVRICVTNEQQGIKQVMLPMFKEALPPGSWTWKAEPRVIEVATGDGHMAQIEFLTYEQDVDKYGGTSRHIVWMDEEPRMRDQYVQNFMRTLDKKGMLLLSMTPLFGMTWAYDEILEGDPSLVDYEEISIYDNKYLPREEVEQAEIMAKKNPEIADAVLYGRFVSPTGLVYRTFNHQRHTVAPFERRGSGRPRAIPDDWMIVLGIDTHESMRNPHAVAFCAITPEQRIYVFDELQIYGLISDLADAIKDKLKEWNIEYRLAIMDISAQSAIAGIKHDKELMRNGIKRIKTADKKKGSPLEGRNKIKELLYFDDEEQIVPDFYITKNCAQTIWQMRHYIYDDWKGSGMKDQRDPKEDVRKKKDHLLDAIRYVVQENFKYRPKDFKLPKPKADGKHLIRYADKYKDLKGQVMKDGKPRRQGLPRLHAPQRQTGKRRRVRIHR